MPAWMKTALVAVVATASVLLASVPTTRVVSAGPPPFTGGFLPVDGGIGLIVYTTGGSMARLADAARTEGCALEAAWRSTPSGQFQAHIYGAPAFVNAAFVVGLANGELPPNTPIMVRCGKPDLRSGRIVQSASVRYECAGAYYEVLSWDLPNRIRQERQEGRLTVRYLMPRGSAMEAGLAVSIRTGMGVVPGDRVYQVLGIAPPQSGFRLAAVSTNPGVALVYGGPGALTTLNLDHHDGREHTQTVTVGIPSTQEFDDHLMEGVASFMAVPSGMTAQQLIGLLGVSDPYRIDSSLPISVQGMFRTSGGGWAILDSDRSGGSQCEVQHN